METEIQPVIHSPSHVPQSGMMSTLKKGAPFANSHKSHRGNPVAFFHNYQRHGHLFKGIYLEMDLFPLTFTYCFNLDFHRNFLSKVTQCYQSQTVFQYLWRSHHSLYLSSLDTVQSKTLEFYVRVSAKHKSIILFIFFLYSPFFMTKNDWSFMNSNV